MLVKVNTGHALAWCLSPRESERLFFNYRRYNILYFWMGQVVIESSLSRHLWFELTDYNGFDQKFFTPGSAIEIMYNIIETDRLRGVYRVWKLWTWEHFEESDYHQDILRDVEKFTSHIPFLVRLKQLIFSKRIMT